MIRLNQKKKKSNLIHAQNLSPSSTFPQVIWFDPIVGYCRSGKKSQVQFGLLQRGTIR